MFNPTSKNRSKTCASHFLDNFTVRIQTILLTPRFNEGIWKAQFLKPFLTVYPHGAGPMGDRQRKPLETVEDHVTLGTPR
jgi:hypothetical protein